MKNPENLILGEVFSLKVYVSINGVSRGNPGPAAATMFIADEEGKILTTNSRFLGPALTSDFAEWSALEGAVDALVFLTGEYDELEAEIRSSNEMVVRQFNRKQKISDPTLQELAWRVWENQALTPALRVSLKHVPLEENKEAAAAVNKELDSYQEWLKTVK